MIPLHPLMPSDLSVSHLRRIIAFCDRFETDWRAGKRPRIEDLLPQVSRDSRPALLHRLVLLELELRRSTGDQPTAAEFHTRFSNYCAIIDLAFASQLGGVDSAKERQLASSPSESNRDSVVGPFRIGWRDNNFEIVSNLGAGGMGVVFKARQLKAGNRLVALKCIRPDFLSYLRPDERNEVIGRFLGEIEAVSKLDHPNLVPVFEVGEIEGCPYFAMKYLDGGSLADLLQNGPLSNEMATAIIEPIARAVHHAHQHGILHRDLKPANILLHMAPESFNATPFVADFGLAKQLKPLQLHVIPSRSGIGTFQYMSPEQARGNTAIDARSDVYGLGATLYHMLTGKPPFDDPGKAESYSEEAASPRSSNASVARDLQTICLKALEKSPERRYQSANDMADDVRSFMLGVPIRARRQTWADRGVRWTKRNPTLTVLVAIATLLLGLVGFMGWHNYFGGKTEESEIRKIRFTTNPIGARVAFVPIDRNTGEPVPEQAVHPRDVTPLKTQLKPGRYLVSAVIEGHGFHEVYREVPARGDEQARGPYGHQSWTVEDDGTIELPPIARIPNPTEATAGMVFFPGGEFDVGDDNVQGAKRHRRNIAPYWLAQTEVTVGQYKKVKNQLPDGLSPNAALTAESDPITYVKYFNAIDFAERIGLRLPDEYEYEFAATNGGTTKFPWGDDKTKLSTWSFGPVRTPNFDQTRTETPVFGLYSGVAELTDSRMIAPIGLPQAVRDASRNSRVIRGGPFSVADGRPNQIEWIMTGPCFRHGIDEDRALPGLGFRCARSYNPRFLRLGNTK
jgi:eukaryotic-like serine/threonine-protein kinase